MFRLSRKFLGMAVWGGVKNYFCEKTWFYLIFWNKNFSAYKVSLLKKYHRLTFVISKNVSSTLQFFCFFLRLDVCLVKFSSNAVRGNENISEDLIAILQIVAKVFCKLFQEIMPLKIIWKRKFSRASHFNFQFCESIRKLPLGMPLYIFCLLYSGSSGLKQV